MEPVTDYYEWYQEFNVGIELEVAYDASKRIYLKCFDEEDDLSIDTNVRGAQAQEFILKKEYIKYFKHKDEVDKEILDLLRICYPNNGSCGTHVHLSHPSVTMEEYPGFLRYFDEYWVANSQEKMRKKYPQVRESSKFAVDNGGFDYDRESKYRQMNILPSLRSDDGLVHVEFRGYDGLPNPSDEEYDDAVAEAETPDVAGVGARIEMEMLSFYIEDLCDEFAKAFWQFKTGQFVVVRREAVLERIKDVLHQDVDEEVSVKYVEHLDYFGIIVRLLKSVPTDVESILGAKPSRMGKEFRDFDRYCNVLTYILSEVRFPSVNNILHMVKLVSTRVWNGGKIYDPDEARWKTPLFWIWSRNRQFRRNTGFLKTLEERNLKVDVYDLAAFLGWGFLEDLKATLTELKSEGMWISVDLTHFDEKMDNLFPELSLKDFGDISCMGAEWVNALVAYLIKKNNGTTRGALEEEQLWLDRTRTHLGRLFDVLWSRAAAQESRVQLRF